MTEPEPMVTIAHCVDRDGTRLCIPGLRAFCARHGFDWRQFLRQGVPISQLERIDDAMARQVVERARRGTS